ncbi:hypothetical protein L1049_012287 [Liquidambar formosana]|uniref:Annexin n=1 Tax=Liquidambar formosana TaxID=63359 RepID=A0AAP0RSI6_LIQFO
MLDFEIKTLDSPKAQCLGFKIDPPRNLLGLKSQFGYQPKKVKSQLLVALVSSYRYEGPRVNEEIAKSEAKTASTAIKTADKKKPIEDEEVLDAVLTNGVDDDMKEAVTRVIVTRADVDMKEIREDYHKQYGVSLSKKVEDITNGNYKDFLLTLVARGD